jgi:hypothetical protein
MPSSVSGAFPTSVRPDHFSSDLNPFGLSDSTLFYTSARTCHTDPVRSSATQKPESSLAETPVDPLAQQVDVTVSSGGRSM